jgi:basic membrane protein A
MKFAKKLTALFLSLAMVLALTACGGSTSDTSSTADSSSDAAADTAATSDTGLKICIITTSGIDDGSFNQNCYEGIQAFLADHPDCTVTDIKEPDYNELVPTVERMVGDYDAFVLPGFNFAGIGDVAAANPDTYFLVVDSTITDGEGNDVTLDNVYTMTFSEQESGFFAGVAAAMETTTNKVAVINGMAYPSNVNYEYGFMSGVNYANAHYGTSAEYVELASYAGVDVTGANVGGNYIGDFADEATGKVVGEALIAAGCDVLFVAAGNAGNGAFTAAKEADGVWLIGCDVDQYNDGFKGSDNIMLTSTLKKMDVHVEKQLEAIYDGTFAGEDAFLSVANEGVGYVDAEGSQQLSADTLDKLAECYDLVKDGTIIPAANFNGYTPTDFPGL